MFAMRMAFVAALGISTFTLTQPSQKSLRVPENLGMVPQRGDFTTKEPHMRADNDPT